MGTVYNLNRGATLPIQKPKTMLICTSPDTWDAVKGVHTILDHLYRTDLGDGLSRQEFETVGQIQKVLASMLADHGVEVD